MSIRTFKQPTTWDNVPIIVDVAYISNLLQIHPDRVYEKLKSGELHGFKACREWRIKKEDLLLWIDKQFD